MRALMSTSARFSVLCSAICAFGFAQSPESLPGCEAPPALRAELKEKLDWSKLQNMPYAESIEYGRTTLNSLEAKYPRELEAQRQFISRARYVAPEEVAALQKRYREAVARQPVDPLMKYLLAESLINRNTPEAISLLESIKSTPGFPAPYLELANVYSSGKRMDKTKALENLEAYQAACPSLPSGSWLLGRVGSKELQAKVAAALRERLAKETDLGTLSRYRELWGLEFRLRPPKEHDAVRKQVAADLKRLETANPKPDAAWAAMLLDGLKQSGASKEAVTAAEDKLVRDHPGTMEAYRTASQRWRNENKEPEDHKNTEAWAKYNAAYLKALDGWIREYPGIPYLKSDRAFAVANDPGAKEAEARAAIEKSVAIDEKYNRPSPYIYNNSAYFLVDHGWAPQRALEWARKCLILADEERARAALDDNRDPNDPRAKYEERSRIYRLDTLLGAAMLARDADAVKAYASEIDGPAPKEASVVSYYWHNRAQLAVLTNRKADALEFYRLALHSRLEPERWVRGRFRDPLTDGAKALWKEMGGTETAWALWSAPAAPSGKKDLAEGRWEKPTKKMPAFELADLTGKSWRLKNLEGKAVLINVWATWCGPCQAELPKLEKLYQNLKDRSEYQILTFNIDTSLGLVAPFVKEKGYTFPVLPAYTLVNELLDSVGVPQNWILDGKGTWQLTQLGYDSSEPDWPSAMRKKMDSVR